MGRSYSSIPGASRFSKSKLDQVYKRGLAAYMSSGNRPKTSQHAWAMARVKSDFVKKEAAKIRREGSKKDDDTLKKNMRKKKKK